MVSVKACHFFNNTQFNQFAQLSLIKYLYRMKNSEAVSKILNTLKAISKDTRIPRRYVLQVLKDRSKNLIAQKLGERTITDELNLYTEVTCIAFEKVEVIKCPIVTFRMCKTLMRSKKPLPELVFSRLGASIKEITSVDGDFEFKLVTEDQYRRNKKRKYIFDSEVYVYLSTDNYLYIPDHEIRTLDVTLLTMNTEDAEGCNTDECKNAWDYPFIVPHKLEDVVFKEALQIISNTRQIPQEPNPNGIEQG